ncbi:preQ(1) synthase [Gimesia aquarii]|uniref:NADPH-dependent 7-cyano-7-deazaguanine reductase n=1 Tax=Gimesia aquarii TaxID=2527964 RepID=A0A517VX38_9PLAN|nr:preQ(1) synthase [Gimesia aquarii]QDT97566.1 NADPH-dependent 7-cyano-7-deazaguanine reductase [Gimesia aquarii]
MSETESFRHLLETFENPYPNRDYVMETVCPEFTSMCPKTGQPDFGTLIISYIPDQVCFELKSLKLYLQSYRNVGAFYEDVTNRILDDLIAVTDPRWIELRADFTPRGGISSSITASHQKEED